MSKGILILGTGIGVGKTYVSNLIFKKLSKLGTNVGYYKPIITGASVKDGDVFADEVDFIYSSSEIKVNANDFASYIYQNPCAPHIASNIEQNIIELYNINNDFFQLSSIFDYLIVEGVDDLFLPLNIETNSEILPIDLIKNLDLSVLLVTDSEDGCVSKTCLSTHYLLSNDVDIKGVVMNKFNKESLSHIDNRNIIELILGAPVMTTIGNNDSSFNILVNKLKDCFSDIKAKQSVDNVLCECDISLGE